MQIAAAAEAKAFSAAEVLKQARALAAEKFVRPKNDLPKVLQGLSYDQYREIRVKPERAIWSSEGLAIHCGAPAPGLPVHGARRHICRCRWSGATHGVLT